MGGLELSSRGLDVDANTPEMGPMIKKARKIHQCTACGGVHLILKGERYWRGKTGVVACLEAVKRDNLTETKK